MRRIIATFLLCMCLHSARAKEVQGICIDKGLMYYVADNVLISHDIRSNEVLARYEPQKDTALVGSITRKTLKSFSITADTAIAIAKERIRNLYVQNVSVIENKIVLGIRYKFRNEIHGALYYALVELDEQMKFRDYYLLQGLKQFNMPPFHALQFKDVQTVLLPSIDEKDKEGKVSYYEFKLDKKNHQFTRSVKSSGRLGFYKYNHIMHNNLLSPVIYMASGSGAYFYQHPLPMIYETDGKLLFDPYRLEKKRDTLLGGKGENNTVVNYIYSPSFPEACKGYGNILLATGFSGEDMYMAVTTSKDGKSIELLRYNVITGDQQMNMMDIPVKDRYFVFSGGTLYILDYSSGRGVISYGTL